MKRLSEKEYNRKLEKIKNKNIQKEYRKNLSEEKKKYSRRFKIETSKLIAIYLFALLNGIVTYAMVAMWTFVDFSYLGILISDIAAQVLIYAIYCMKAYKAKKSEEEMKFRQRNCFGSVDNILTAGANAIEPVPVNGDVETFVQTQEDNSVDLIL